MRGYLCVLALCVGAVAGTVALKAQGTPPAYVMVQIEVTGNADTFAREYAAKVASTLEPFGGRFLARRGRVVSLDGDAPKPIVALVRFDGMDKAQAWYNSAAYQAILPVRKDNTKSNFFVVEGLPQ
jgi:uncharacterized protein (DUF1330 family)